MGRAESIEAPTVAWAMAAINSSPSASTAPVKSTSPRWGNSSTGSSRRLKRGPAPMISTSPSLEESVTAPIGIFLMASVAKRAGITMEPSSRTSTSVVVLTVISRSVPVTLRLLPCTSHKTPCRMAWAGRTPTPRLALENTSARSSLSARIRKLSHPFCFYVFVTKR